jgi:far upstream element-binding protein
MKRTNKFKDGGYQAYVAMWYQAMAAQQQAGGQNPGDPTKPPGTS